MSCTRRRRTPATDRCRRSSHRQEPPTAPQAQLPPRSPRPRPSESDPALPLALGVAGDAPLLRSGGVLPLPLSDRHADCEQYEHPEHDPAGPALRDLHHEIAQAGGYHEEDQRLYEDRSAHLFSRRHVTLAAPRGWRKEEAGWSRRSRSEPKGRTKLRRTSTSRSTWPSATAR